MQATAPATRQITQSTTGRSFALRLETAADWAGEWPTELVDEVFVTESPGSQDGSIFVFWLGDKTLDSAGILESIQSHLDDHDVVGVRVVHDFPAHVHSSLKGDLAELQRRARAARGEVEVREGVRVRVKRNQGRIGGDKFPGREGVVQKIDDLGASSEYCYVALEATQRAAARTELFSFDVLDVLTQPDEVKNLPPLTGKQIATQLEACGSIVFEGASYVLGQRDFEDAKPGWTVHATYPDGTKRSFGEQHSMTRMLAVHLASRDAIDWFLNRRNAPNK